MPQTPRWVEVTPSPFPHEAEGLRLVRELLPQTSPYRAWSNVEFRDGQGKWHEVDLIVLGQRRLHLVELKYYSGTLRGDDLRWRRDGHRAEDSPLKLARRKAQRLASKLRDELVRWAEETGTPIDDVRRIVPFVQESVFLHHPGLRSMLPSASQLDLFGLDGNERSSGLPGIASRLLEPPTPTDAVGANREEILAMLMGRIGLVRRRQREVGSWVIDDEPLGEGEGWQDWSATHRHIGSDRARIRVRVVPPGAESQEVTRVRKVVEHEYRVMSRLTHDAVLRPRDLVDDDLGVGLVYPYDESFQRLDLWQADRPQGVPLTDQLSLLRQVAEAVGYAHGHRVVHRGLTPSAIWVKEQPSGGLRVLVGDWQSAGSATGENLTGVTTTGVTALVAAELVNDRLGVVLQPAAVDLDRRQAEAFQAPEGVWNAGADRVRLDVFSLGAVAYFVLAGRPPAADRAGLRERIQRDHGLDLAADLPQISSAMRALVLEATRPSVSDRLADVGAFLERLAAVERAGTALDEVIDPLDAIAGAVIDDRWQLERRLGAGSTAVGLLVSDLTIGTGPDARRVLKVAINDAATARLDAEASVLASLNHPRVVRLVDGPIQVGTRRALVLEPAGDQTLADVLSARQRLSLDLLERWGTDLLEALVVLDKAGVDHRDIKPANLGVREGRSRTDRVKHLTLFDFSLTQAGATAVTAGTPPYLDPFLDSPGRGRFDSAAERYSAAVVLFEMATGRPPVYGDGLSDPALIPDDATVDPSLFDSSLAAALVPFFHRGLSRRVADRQHTAAEMLAEWKALFAPVDSTVPDDADAQAESADASTSLSQSGLSARALSAIEPLAVSTVGDLVAIDPVRLNRLSGVSEPTRREVKQRAKRWRDRFGVAVIGRGAQRPERPSGGSLSTPATAADLLVATVGNARADSRRHAAALLLGVEDGVDAFVTQGELGEALKVTRPRAAQLVGEMQDGWAADAGSRQLLTEVADVATEALAAFGGVATVDELAGAVLASMGPAESDQVDPARLAAGLLRVAVDRTDALDRAEAGGEPLAKRRRNGRLLALATQPDLLDLADALARRADELIRQARTASDPVIAAGRAGAALREVAGAGIGARAPLPDARLVQLAASLSQTAAVSGRGELHDRDLDAVAALRMALAGVTGAQPIAAQEIRDRVRARFPQLPALPERPRLDTLVSDAGLNLRYDEQHRAFRALAITSSTDLESRMDTWVALPGAPLSVSGGQLDRRLTESARSRSFLALGVSAPRHDRAVTTLVERHGARVLDVTGVFIDALRTQSEGKIGWTDVVAADARPAGTREALGLSRLVEFALPAINRAIEAMDGESPLLLVEASPLSRYDKLSMLSRWTDLSAPRRQAVWVLVPQLAGNTGPMLDGRPLPLAAPGQFLRLDDEWLAPVAPATA
ncbi:BREX system serine/threonine kinase PglW [Modestobacter sp. VKM Ac-2985]|uniref:BREX system serine/threonine kinase PglW n=1 Tax=Modestobacter sp. VKM Ac-2985 TaxID=3004139 RepID=UPI0022AB6269|nr:BREX system serine/threonine kinase PglW [Modestobacter sp. VKM Ac-2985]MCZ2839926.1 BREX system serine/threonine kinase PglW [Modestobacter sp. VKM Ac-2985]